MNIKAVFLAAFLAISIGSAVGDKKVVCYFGSWSIYRQGNGKFDISNIDPNLCTHIIYTFIGLGSDGSVQVLDSWADLPSGLNGFGKTTALRQKSSGTKVMIAIGGWNQGSTVYSQVFGNPSTRSRFVQSVVSFLKQYKFDGIDIDWEYPNQRGGQPADKQNFVDTLRQLKQELSKSGLLLSVAVAAAESSASQSYIINQVAQNVDFINLMAYDFNGAWNNFAGQNAPLYSASRESGNQAKLNVNSAVRYWLSQGAPASKLVLGIPLYGRSYTLQNSGNNKPGAPVSGAGAAGPYTQEAGMLAYNEICESIGKGGWTVARDNEQRVPYAFKGNQWVTYDDVQSVKDKTGLVNSLGLGGAMVWSVDTDDFRGSCGQKYPLLSTVYSTVRNGAPVPNPSPQTTVPPTRPTVAPPPPPPPSGVCTREGYVRDPHDCNAFYYCQKVNGKWSTFAFHCGTGLAFDPSINGCNYRQNVPGC